MKSLLLFCLSLGLFFLLVQPTYASYFFLTPDSASVNKDSNLSFQVKLNTEGEVINGVSAYVAFPQDKLDIGSIQINNETLPIVAEQTVDGNVVKFSGANLSSVNGSGVLIGTINFKAKATGTATVSFIPGSAVPRTLDSSDSLNLGNSKGASIQITDSGSGGDNNGGGSNPSPNPSGQKLPRCQDREDDFKSRLGKFTSTSNELKARLDTIYALVDDYYNSSGKNLPAYIAQRQTVDNKRVSAITQLNNFNISSQAFSCRVQNPRDLLNQLKQQGHQTQNAFNDYKQALKKLISILRNS